MTEMLERERSPIYVYISIHVVINSVNPSDTSTRYFEMFL